MDVNAVLYSGCMATAPQLLDTTVCEQEAETDNDDDDNVVGDWDPDKDLFVGGGVAKNNNQEIAANIEKEKYIVDFNDKEGMIPTMISIWLWGRVFLVTIIKRWQHS